MTATDDIAIPAARRWGTATLIAFRTWPALFAICVAPSATVFLNGGRLWRYISDNVGRSPIHILKLPEHSTGARVPGTDFLSVFIAFGVLGLESVVVAFDWSVVDPRRASIAFAYARISAATHLVLVQAI